MSSPWTNIISDKDLPVSEELCNRLMRPFAMAATITLKEMAHTDLTLKSMYRRRLTAEDALTGISAVVHIKGAISGSIIISFAEPCAREFTRRVLAGFDENAEPAEHLVHDCVRELANIITGQARGILAGGPYAFTMTTPASISGSIELILRRPNMTLLIMVFSSEVGEFILRICLPLEEPPK